jgi:hypothetical protein
MGKYHVSHIDSVILVKWAWLETLFAHLTDVGCTEQW